MTQTASPNRDQDIAREVLALRRQIQITGEGQFHAPALDEFWMRLGGEPLTDQEAADWENFKDHLNRELWRHRAPRLALGFILTAAVLFLLR